MDREVWRAAVHGVTKSRTRLSAWTDSSLGCTVMQTHGTSHWLLGPRVSNVSQRPPPSPPGTGVRPPEVTDCESEIVSCSVVSDSLRPHGL